MKTKIHIGQHWQCKECLHDSIIQSHREISGEMTEEEVKKYRALKKKIEERLLAKRGIKPIRASARRLAGERLK